MHEEELIRAAKAGEQQKIITLITARVDINYQDALGDTALIWASYYGHTAIVQLLCVNNANPNMQGEYKNTALHWAAFQGHQEIIKILLEYNADTNIMNTNGIKPAEFAHQNNKSFDHLVKVNQPTINTSPSTPKLFA